MIGINVIDAFSTVYAVEPQKKTNDPEPRPETSREIARAGGVSQCPLAKAGEYFISIILLMACN